MSHDTWIHRIARVCIRPLLATAVTPNQLTVARGVTGLLAAALVAIGSGWTLAAGTGLFLVSMVLDRADGELARATGRSSPFGHRLDLWTDAACDTAILLALGIGQRHGEFGALAPLMGIVAAASAAVIFSQVLEVDRKLGPESVVFPAVAGFDPDDAIALVPIGMLAGLGDPLLVAATVATPAAALLVIAHLRRLLRLRSGR